MAKFIDKAGERHDCPLSPEMYQAAKDNNMTFRQYINTKFETLADLGVDTFTQLCADEGLLFSHKKDLGVNSPVLQKVFGEGIVNMDASGLVRETNNSTFSRILFPAAVLEYVESKLQVDRESIPAAFDNLIAFDTTVANSRVTLPKVNYERTGGPEDTRSKIISQLAEPDIMLSITTSDTAYKIKTESIGMIIADEALSATTLDLVGMAVTRQAAVERAAKANEFILSLLNGDVDTGITAVTAVQAKTYDTALDTIATLSHKAWVKWLYAAITTRRIDYVVCNIDSALLIEGRSGKPTVTTDNPTSERIDAPFTLVAPQLVSSVKMIISDQVPANTILGIDSRYAVGRITNSLAEYSAMEAFVMKRAKGLRFDTGSIYYTPFGSDPMSVLSTTVA